MEHFWVTTVKIFLSNNYGTFLIKNCETFLGNNYGTFLNNNCETVLCNNGDTFLSNNCEAFFELFKGKLGSVSYLLQNLFWHIKY